MPRIRAVIAVAIAVLVVPLAACVAGPAPETTHHEPFIDRALVSQDDDPDDVTAPTTYRVDHPEHLAALEALIVEHDAFGDQGDEPIHADGQRTSLTYWTLQTGEAVHIRFRLDDDSSDFEREVDALVASWIAADELTVEHPPIPQPGTGPSLDLDAGLTLATAVQSEGPLGDGTAGLQRADAASLAALADVLTQPETEPDDIECVWTTTTSVIATDATGATATFEASSCGATGRDQALGQLVAEWAAEDA
ncbi:hypothetical protein [Agrococcus jejuensis]|uniref:PknH-like extracellular domain-containing protein n=1 Tax=Agrococcus jejuensis TaxID=399736 RepID=A0A1G8F9B0_9MICO|nr:hypothetical protein [Agrococcus jejuensis]SDH78569.1 hypothetical protein SAMN04489720_2382 [Agrococcus jejuensis]